MDLLRPWIVLIGLAGCGGAEGPAPAPAPIAAPATTTPCVDGAPLEADDLYRRFEKHSWFWAAGPEDDVPPAEPFGSCTVHQGKIIAADGAVVAELGCGVRILVPGIRDDAGLELGARGAEVLRAWDAIPRGPLVCLGNGPDQTRCRFDRASEDGDTDFTAYVVAGALPAGVDALSGADAEAFLAEREVVEISHSVWCH
jgi:hypothetical protein